MAESPNSNDSSGGADNGDSWEAEIFELQDSGRYDSVSKATGEVAKPHGKSDLPSKDNQWDDLALAPVKGREGSADPTMLAGDYRGTGSADATMLAGQERAKGADATILAGQEHAKGAGPTMKQAAGGRQSADPTLRPGQDRQSGDPAVMRSRSRPQGAEPGVMLSRSRQRGAEPTVAPGEGRRRGAGPTLLAGDRGTGSAEATMVPGQGVVITASPTMVPGQGVAKSAAPTMVPGESRRREADPTMVPVLAPPPEGEAAMAPFSHSGEGFAGASPEPAREAPILKTPDPSPVPKRDSRTISEATVINFIDELRSAASAQGMDFSIIQPDGMKFDFFTDSKALRVSFGDREQAVDRIVVRELSPPAKTQEQNVGGNEARSLLGAGSARRRMLAGESGGRVAGERNDELDVATIRDAKTGALDWNEPHALEEVKTATGSNQVALEAHYFDAEEGHNWLIELVNSTPAPAGETTQCPPGQELTPEGAKRLVRLLLICLRSVIKHKSSI